jgi:hypothetical protein
MIGNSYDITTKNEKVRSPKRLDDAYPVNVLKYTNINEYNEGNIDYNHLYDDQVIDKYQYHRECYTLVTLNKTMSQSSFL